VDRLGLTNITLVAHDLGGLIGLGLAARHPELIAGLVLTNTFGWPPQRALRAVLKLMGRPAIRSLNTTDQPPTTLHLRALSVGRHPSRRARTAFLGPTRDRARRRTFHRLMHDTSRSTQFLGQIEAALHSSLREQPAMTIFGQHNDPLHVPRTSGASSSRTHAMSSSPRQPLPMNDDPHGVTAAIQSWCHEVTDDGSDPPV
jgi:haloalkane dehalogenase